MQHKILKKILEFKKKKKKKKEKKGQDGNQHLRLPEIPSQLKKFQQIFFLIKRSITILLNNYIKVNKIKSLN